jgi:excisionase family DNA binding protein
MAGNLARRLPRWRTSYPCSGSVPTRRADKSGECWEWLEREAGSVMDRLQAAITELVEAIRAEIESSTLTTPDRLLSVDEAAALLGIGRSALYGEIAAGRVRSIKIGRRRLIPSSTIDEVLRNGLPA